MKITMINLCIFITNGQRKYLCRFFKEYHKVITIGPFPAKEGKLVDVYRGGAETEDEARENIAEILGPGCFFKASPSDNKLWRCIDGGAFL